MLHDQGPVDPGYKPGPTAGDIWKRVTESAPRSVRHRQRSLVGWLVTALLTAAAGWVVYVRFLH